MIAGYQFGGHDNDSYMLGEETRPAASAEEREYYDWRFVQNGGQHPATCPKCGRKTDANYVSPTFKLGKKRMDVGSTYDGYTIVSERFRQFCADLDIADVDFVSLPSEPRHYWFRVQKTLKVDTHASQGLRFLNYCDRCHSYAGVFGTSRLRFIGVETTVPKGFSRTDLEFAQAHEQSPVIVADPDLGAAIHAQGFTGVDLIEIGV